MPAEFLNHTQAEDGSFTRVVQDVDANQSGVQLLITGFFKFDRICLRLIIQCRYRYTTWNSTGICKAVSIKLKDGRVASATGFHQAGILRF